MAQPACTSFAYNAELRACFLKRGGGRATCASPTTVCAEQARAPAPAPPQRLCLASAWRCGPAFQSVVAAATRRRFFPGHHPHGAGAPAVLHPAPFTGAGVVRGCIAYAGCAFISLHACADARSCMHVHAGALSLLQPAEHTTVCKCACCSLRRSAHACFRLSIAPPGRNAHPRPFRDGYKLNGRHGCVVGWQAQDLVVQHFSCGSWSTFFRSISGKQGVVMGR